jgi:hypothetical protein
VVDRFAADLRDAVEYAKQPAEAVPRSGAVYGAAGDRPPREKVRASMARYMDKTYDVGPLD